jgi:hypothetical protein
MASLEFAWLEDYPDAVFSSLNRFKKKPKDRTQLAEKWQGAQRAIRFAGK